MNRSGHVIAIDGPAGSGKSTLAIGLAARLGLPYVNTGLMYRALTARALARGLDLADGPGLASAMAWVRFSLSTEVPPVIWVDGEAPSAELTSDAVEAAVSEVARHLEVRAAMRDAQRALGQEGAVMEGRDIATVVFPDADLKIFLDATEEERASRRVAERGGREDVGQDLVQRDEKDARVNPFVPADGAVTIDTSSRDAEEVLAEALRLAAERGIVAAD
ncbi:MAG: (d)CMP kinase [Actinomycetota bacterium]